MTIKEFFSDMDPMREQTRRDATEKADTSNLTKKEIKDSKYYDEGQDGDYNSASISGDQPANIEEGNDDHDDEESHDNSNASSPMPSEDKDEKNSYVSYDGNAQPNNPSDND